MHGIERPGLQNHGLIVFRHGRSEAECLGVVEDLKRDTPLREHAVLRSLKELKKISMTYFA